MINNKQNNKKEKITQDAERNKDLRTKDIKEYDLRTTDIKESDNSK